MKDIRDNSIISKAIRHHRALHLIAWLMWTVPFFLIIVSNSRVAGKFFPDIPMPVIIVFLAVVLGLNALGDISELGSCNRRIRSIEYVQKALPTPMLMVVLISMIYIDWLGSYSFVKYIIIFIIIFVLFLNIKSIHDLVNSNREIVTCSEMKELERRADEAGLSYYEMMEKAGAEAFGYICEEEIDLLDDLLIFCGKGNNGGDGFVVARKAMEYGCDVTVVLACGLPTTPDAITNYELIKDKARILIPEDDEELSQMLNECSHINSDERLSLLNKLRRRLHNLDNKDINDEDYVIVDAIFGTGFHGKPEGIPEKAIAYMNNLRGVNRIYSLDVPSGLPGDERDETAEYFGAVYADCVITFHARKPVHKNRGPEISNHMKKVIVADIGITTTLEKDLFFGDDKG